MDMSEVMKLDAPTKITKLSQAIRIGAKLRPQCTNGWYRHDGRSCAFGAAAEVMDMDPVELHKTAGPMGNEAFCAAVGRDIACANDSGWTREAIADKLEALGY